MIQESAVVRRNSIRTGERRQLRIESLEGTRQGFVFSPTGNIRVEECCQIANSRECTFGHNDLVRSLLRYDCKSQEFDLLIGSMNLCFGVVTERRHFMILL